MRHLRIFQYNLFYHLQHLYSMNHTNMRKDISVILGVFLIKCEKMIYTVDKEGVIII
jgi:hypothetical protein